MSTTKQISHLSILDYIFFQIKPFKENNFGIDYWENVIKNLISLEEKEFVITISWNNQNLKFFVWIPNYLQNFWENIFYNNFPTSECQIINDIKLIKPTHFLNPSKHSYFYNKKYFEKDWNYIDPFQNILSFFNCVDENSIVNIYFKIKFVHSKNIAKKVLFWLKKLYYLLWYSSKQSHELWYANIGFDWKWLIKKYPDLYFSIWIWQSTTDKKLKASRLDDLQTIFWWFISNWKIRLTKKEKFTPWSFNQIINFFHIPLWNYFVKWLDYVLYRKLQYPSNLPTLNNTEKNEITVLWKTDFRWKSIEFWIRSEDKFRHMYIVWKTWTWKTTLVSQMVQSDMIAWNWLCLLDPHWDLIDEILTKIPSYRINDIVLFDVSDTEFPIGFNLLQVSSPEEKNLIVSWIVWAFYKLFDYSRWPRLEYILRNIFLSLVEYPNATLIHALRIMTDSSFRKEVLTFVKDQIILDFWHNEFDKRNTQQREIAIWPLTNKIWQFLSSKIVRNIFGQPNTKLNLRKVMDEWKIVLVNLSKWKIWEDNAHMIWSLLVTKFQIDAMSRANIPYEQRKDFFLYIDEFQNFATKSFINILSEARKYKLSLILANQYTSQIMPEVKDAIFGNVGTTISFNIWNEDAKIISEQFKNQISLDDLISLPKYKAYIRLMTNGIISDPFSMTTIASKPWENIPDLLYKVKSQSRQRYAIPSEELEKLINARDLKKVESWELKFDSKNKNNNQRLSTIHHQPSTIYQEKLNTQQNKQLENIKIWEWYDTTIKLKYNYGLFLVYEWMEGLLHKQIIKTPEWLDWKKFFNIGDKVKAKVIWFKDVNGEKKVVWGME